MHAPCKPLLAPANQLRSMSSGRVRGFTRSSLFIYGDVNAPRCFSAADVNCFSLRRQTKKSGRCAAGSSAPQVSRRMAKRWLAFFSSHRFLIVASCRSTVAFKSLSFRESYSSKPGLFAEPPAETGVQEASCHAKRTCRKNLGSCSNRYLPYRVFVDR